MRDSRKVFDQGAGDPSTNVSPVVNKVCLKMSLENVVKDIPLISDNSWTYGDLMVSMIDSSHPWLLISVMYWVTDVRYLYSLDYRK